MNEEKNEVLFENSQFTLKTSKGDVFLRKYSLSIEIKLLKSGVLNKLMSAVKEFGLIDEKGVIQKNKIKDFEKQMTEMAGMDFINIGELLEVSIDIIWEMVSENIRLKTNKEDFLDTIKQGEVFKFLGWIMHEFATKSSFFAQGKRKVVVKSKG